MAYIKYTPEILAEAAANSKSVYGVLRYLGVPVTGGAHANISRRLKQFEIDTSHFTGKAHNKGQASVRRRTAESILQLSTPGTRRQKPHLLRRALLEMGVPHRCGRCLLEEWQGEPLILHVDHINGDWIDNRMENLRFPWPNCHSLTPTYAGRLKNRKTTGP